jgi:hypothetical protein
VRGRRWGDYFFALLFLSQDPLLTHGCFPPLAKAAAIHFFY